MFRTQETGQPGPGYVLTVNPTKTDAALNEVTEAVQRYAAAINAGDRAGLDAILGPHHHFASGHGRIFDRAERLDGLLGAAKGLSALSFDVVVTSSGGPGTEIVLADFTARFRSGDIERGLTTLVFLRAPNGWLLSHQHNSHHVS
jgi:hypothetical protein